MRIISRRILREFARRYPDAATALETWHATVKAARWQSTHDVRLDYATASFLPDNRIVFNIRGNHYHLVTLVFFESQRVYVRFVGTHEQYDHIDAETI